MVEVYAVYLNEKITEDDYARLLKLVSEEKREKVKKRKNKKSSIATLYGDILARYALMKCLDIRNEDIQFHYSEHGKPYLVGNEGVFFNVSHSGNWVVCAIGDQEVGIDIERLRADQLKVAKRFFTDEEYHSILVQPEAEQSAYFCKLWTLKECYLKWSGEGLTVPLDSFSFRMNQETNQFEVRKLNQESHQLEFRQYKIDKDYQISVCSMEKQFCNDIHTIDIDDLNEWNI